MFLIRDVTVVTMDATRRVIVDGAIAIDGPRIAAVDKTTVLGARYPNANVVAGRGMVAIPGLIDAHAHADQSILRGTTDDLHWIPFLEDWIDPYLGRRDPADTRAAYGLSALEMVKGGTTCFISPNVDPSDEIAALIAVTGQIGIRAVFAFWVEPDTDMTPTVARVEATHGADGGRVQGWFGLKVPRQPGDHYQPDFYPRVADEARRLGTGVVYHFCSEIEDAAYYESTFGVRPAEWARDHDALGPHVAVINACWSTPGEIDILAATGTHVVYSPSATAKMATGVTPAVDMLAAGVNVALGTDGGANNNSHDMIREMKAACLLQNSVRRQAGALPAETALELATIGGARAIGRADELGSLEAGKRADVVLVDLAQSHSMPVADAVSSLVYAAHGGNVDTVFIDGRLVVRDRVVKGVDEASVLADADAAARRVRGRILPARAPRWPRV